MGRRNPSPGYGKRCCHSDMCRSPVQAVGIHRCNVVRRYIPVQHVDIRNNALTIAFQMVAGTHWSKAWVGWGFGHPREGEDACPVGALHRNGSREGSDDHCKQEGEVVPRVHESGHLGRGRSTHGARTPSGLKIMKNNI